jgi:hypothetical protein
MADRRVRDPDGPVGDRAREAAVDDAMPRPVVIGIPFELMDREAAHREMDALFAEQARRAKE